MKQIKLSENQYGATRFFALVDDADYEFLSTFNWKLRKCGESAYAITMIQGRLVTMHSFLMPDTISLKIIVDHKNQNGLDNQRSNLRYATYAQNLQNRRKHKVGSSKFKGVSLKHGRWCARLTKNGCTIQLGDFDTPEKAAKAYNEAAIRYFGEFASLNLLEKVSNEL